MLVPKNMHENLHCLSIETFIAPANKTVSMQIAISSTAFEILINLL